MYQYNTPPTLTSSHLVGGIHPAWGGGVIHPGDRVGVYARVTGSTLGWGGGVRLGERCVSLNTCLPSLQIFIPV